MNIHPTAIVDDGALIGEGTRIWHFSHVQSGAKIGKNCTLGQNVYVGDGAVIGDTPIPNPGVPEPATWAMLIAGFGLVGATMRRRRAAIA